MRARAERVLEDALRVVGLLVWLVVGGPSWTRLLDTPDAVGSGHPVVWGALYVAFAVAFWGATSNGRSPGVRRGLLVTQSLVALALAGLGMPHFEGALFALVAAQTPSVVSAGRAIAWDVAQAAALFPIVLPTHGPLGAAKATGEYLVFALFALAVLYLRQREVLARNELARAHATLLATQSLLADDARSGERLRILREVHDAIGHGLTAASLHLQLAARAGGAPEPIGAAQEAVRSTLREVRTLVHASREDATVDLRTALRALCVGIVEPRVHLALPESLRALDSARAHVTFRCIQEAITNAIRHAEAHNLWIDVTVDGALRATVRDDGVGSDGPPPGSGLEGVRERVAELGGTLAIETRRGAGLTLRIELPAAEAQS
jgi:signal transduction histidine kinase